MVLGLAACGRIGYEPATGDDVPVDAAPIGNLAPCNTPIEVMTLPVPAARTLRALELTETATGLLAAWSVDDAVWVTGLSVVDAGGGVPAIASVQDGEEVNDFGTDDLALAALGDVAILAIDDADGDLIALHPLDGHGQWRTSPKEEMGVHIHGGDFLIADPDEQLFGIMVTDGTDAYTGEIDADSHTQPTPQVSFPAVVPDTAGIAKLGDGYAVLAGRDAQCDLVALADDLTPIAGTAQVMGMTCHNAQLVASGGEQVVAAWNCDDQQVWITGGAIDTDLTGYRSYWGTDGDTANAASNPRLAVAADGVWYAFQVAGNRLGRGLVTASGANDDRVPPDLVVGSGAETYDLAVHAGHAFLFWTTGPSLHAMQLCAP